ncbi:hypothetical protein F5887DRAFT_921869 [Amanita rubescens]|nr:hypothetical protein F5887DRAFT_922737 [Amanita rubescens]KAF8333741.1 hypothetical protein F5887DRAFT_921869 [Amanita rubescens]
MPDKNEEYYLEVIVFQVSEYLRVWKRTVHGINSRLFWKASKRRTSFHCFSDVFIHCGSRSHPMLDPVFSFRTIKQFPVNPNFTLEEWQSVLKLSSLYDMMGPSLTTLPALQIHLAKTMVFGNGSHQAF